MYSNTPNYIIKTDVFDVHCLTYYLIRQNNVSFGPTVSQDIE